MGCIAKAICPENPKYTLILAKVYLEMSHLEGSENYFKKTIMLSPKLADAYKGLGNIYLAQCVGPELSVVKSAKFRKKPKHIEL